MTIILIILITKLLLVTSFVKEIIEPSSLSNKIERKVIGIAKDKNILSLELTITTEKEVIDFNYNHKDDRKQNIYGIGSTTKYLSAVLVFKLIDDKS